MKGRIDKIENPPVTEFIKDMANFLNIDDILLTGSARESKKIIMGTLAKKFPKRKTVVIDSLAHYTTYLAAEDNKVLIKEVPHKGYPEFRLGWFHIESGYDVHLNFSPVIVSKNGLVEYEKLFNLVDKYVHPEYKPSVKAEVIFLTHNEKLHNYNVQNNIPGEDLLWNPQYQEKKVSQYGGTNVRYKNKAKLISQWTALHNQCIPWNTIRYIF